MNPPAPKQLQATELDLGVDVDQPPAKSPLAGGDNDHCATGEPLAPAPAAESPAPENVSQAAVSLTRPTFEPSDDDLKSNIVALEATFWWPGNTVDQKPQGSWDLYNHTITILKTDKGECFTVAWNQLGLRFGHYAVENCFATSTAFRLCDERVEAAGNVTPDSVLPSLQRPVPLRDLWVWCKDYAANTKFRMTNKNDGVNCAGFARLLRQCVLNLAAGEEPPPM